MKMMVVTGLSNEQDFETGESVFVLILNKKLRIPVSQEIATEIIRELYQGDVTTPEVRTSSGYYDSEDAQDDDGVDQI